MYMDIKIPSTRGWRDDSVIRSSGCSCRGPRFSCQHPNDGSQPPVTTVPEHQMSLWPALVPDTHDKQYTRQNTHIQKQCFNYKLLSTW